MKSRSQNNFRIPLMGTFILACLLFASVSHAQQTVEVVVRGSGATMEDARHDAIRQATQQVARQLIIADRRIKNDTIVMDRVLSTMNGYVEKFDLLDSGSGNNGTWLEARIIMSESRIENFIAEVRGSGSRIDGQSAFADLQRANVQNESAQDVMRRAFQGFPYAALNVKLVSVRIPGDDWPSLSSYLLLDVVIEADPAWVSSATGLIGSIAKSSVSLKRRPEPGVFSTDDECVGGYVQGVQSMSPSISLDVRCEDGSFGEAIAKEGAVPFCFINENNVECYALSKRIMSAIDYSFEANLSLVVDFLGDDGKTAKRSSSCLMATGHIGGDATEPLKYRDIAHWDPSFYNKALFPIWLRPQSYFRDQDWFGMRGKVSAILDRRIYASYAVPLDAVDLDSTRAAVVVPVLSTDRHRRIIHDVAASTAFDCEGVMAGAISAYRSRR